PAILMNRRELAFIELDFLRYWHSSQSERFAWLKAERQHVRLRRENPLHTRQPFAKCAHELALNRGLEMQIGVVDENDPFGFLRGAGGIRGVKGSRRKRAERDQISRKGR